jgi:meiotically up-regulated gene 157 (Mug157) protein
MDRRRFLELGAAGVAGAAAAALGVTKPMEAVANATLVPQRPAPAQRCFVSAAVEAALARVSAQVGNPKLAWMFGNCLPNTLDTTVRFRMVDGRPDTFVITGDIDAMWLRDSSAQIWPYLRFVREDAKLAQMVRGVIARQVRCVLLDPYANAFNFDPHAPSPEHADDHTEMKPGVFERKWELDSLCYVIRLSYGYWRASGGEVGPFAEDPAWRQAMALILKTFREQQRKQAEGPYKFERTTTSPSETLWRGYGYPTRVTGLVHTGFRPSDDAGLYTYLIASNYFAAWALRRLAEIVDSTYHDEAFERECELLADEIDRALEQFGSGPHLKYGSLLAYEVDGYGNQLFMDDANVPALLSLPYLGAMYADNPLYRKTRAFVLSPDNPYFFRGRAAEGVGGPHTGLGMIWPLGIVMRALTSSDDDEIRHCVQTLLQTDAGTGFMHESFDQDDAGTYTRKWFGWANGLFGELILKLADERPKLLASL